MGPIERIKQIDKEVTKLRDERFSLETSVREKTLPALKGKCFVYERNCYSCPDSESDYWDVYARVKNVVGSRIHIERFSEDSNGCICIEETEWYGVIGNGYKEIPERKYVAAKTGILRKILSRMGFMPNPQRNNSGVKE